MRVKGIIFLLVLAGIIFLLSLLLTDVWLEHRLEAVGTGIVGAKVEIDNFDASITSLHFRWDSLQVTNPQDTWQNILTTGYCEFNIKFLPLLRGKKIIENVQASNLRSGTKRTTDGFVPKKEKPAKPGFVAKTIQRLQDQVSEAPAWNLDQYKSKINVDSLLKFLQIDSPEKIDSLQNQLGQMYTRWQDTLTQFDPVDDIRQMESKLKSIQPQQIKTINELQSALTAIDQTKKQVDSLRTFVASTKKDLVGDLETARNRLGLVDDWIQEDYRQALQKAKLPELTAQNIGKFLFGAKIVNQINKVLSLADKGRYYSAKLKSDEPKEPKPPRLKGQDIRFSQRGALPEFWIQKIEISGKTLESIVFRGVVSDITSNQRLIGSTTKIDIAGERQGSSLSFVGDLNYLEEIPQESFKLNIAGIPLRNVQISMSELLPGKLEKGVGSIQSSLEMAGESLKSTIRFDGDGVQFDLASEPNQGRIAQLVQNALRSTSNINFTAGIVSNESGTDFSLNSNIDDLIINQLKSQLGQELQAARQRIESEIDTRTAKYKGQINTFVQTRQQSLLAEIAKYESIIQEQTTVVETKRKELEQRIETEKQKQKEKLEEEAKKKLKGVLGK